jgi:uncharacterized protein YbbK (DUF523 family)
MRATLQLRIESPRTPALVVIGAGAAVSQRRVTQRRRRKHMAERMLDPSQQRIRLAQWNHCTFTVLSKCTDSDTLAT